MNNEQQHIIDEVYKNYLFNSEWFPISSVNGGFIGTKSDSDEIMTQDLFINKCKTDPEFSEKWGLKIEERELTLEGRYHIWFTNNYETGMERCFDPNNIPDFDNSYYNTTPTKLITITYNDKTIESYE